jgi:hypothetical protein
VNLSNEILIGALVVGSMVLQFGRRRWSAWRLLAPLAAAGYVAVKYLAGVPTEGNDLVFAGLGVVSGTALGLAASALMRVERQDGVTFLVAGVGYVALWIVVFGARLGFAWGARNAFGHELGVFSYQHQITEDGWIAFFVVQAIGMVVARTVVVGARAVRASAKKAELLAA